MLTKQHPAARIGLFEKIEEAETAETAEDLVIPEDLTELSAEDLGTLYTSAVEAFNDLHGDGLNLSDEDYSQLEALTDGIDKLSTEKQSREASATERAEKAAALAARVNGDSKLSSKTEETDEDSKDGEEDTEEEEEDENNGDNSGETVTASGSRKGPTRINLGRAAARRHLPSQEKTEGIKDVMVASGDHTGYSTGQGIDWLDAGKILDSKLRGISEAQLTAAARKGTHISQRTPLLSIHRKNDLRIENSDATHVEEVLNKAANESRLEGESLVAAGGWCAPSETLYDLLEIETRDGIFSMPEVTFTRGGITRTLGPDFGDLFANFTGFAYTEDQDIAGTYGVDANGIGNDTEGDKPLHRIDCPDFEGYRLGVEGLGLTAGLLQQRGYPEVIARTIRGALVAHDHRVAGRNLAAIEAGSTVVTVPGTQAGVTAPILGAIERQSEYIRYKTRMSRNATLEGIFPFWVRSVIRADLALRNGVDLISVSDSRIDGWFRERKIAPQYVYNWQDLDVTSPLTEWPTTLKFMVYPAGSWIRGTSDIITIDNVYDSQLLGQNDRIALFTEEGSVVVPMSHESHVVSMDFCADGSTAAAIDIDCDGTPVPAPEDPAA